MARDGGQRTEAPTPKRRREARERGQIAKSPELLSWAAILATTLLLGLTLRSAGTGLRDLMVDVGAAIRHPTIRTATNLLGQGVETAAVSVAPLAFGLMVVGVTVELAQVGIKPSLKRLRPRGERLNLLKGLQRLFSGRALWETVKAAARVVIIAGLSWPVLSGLAHRFSGGGAALTTIVGETGQAVLTLVRNVAVVGLVLAAADYLVQRRRVMRDLRMTRKEVKDEQRQSEGDPQLRSAVRAKQLKMSRNRMIGAVSTANVVIVNPTHYAVALRYEAQQGSPEVVAKGAGAVAAVIRAEAERHQVPLVADPPLARVLFRACEVGERIPVELYEAVAKVLAFVFRLSGAGRRPVRGVRRVPGVRVPAEITRGRRRQNLNSAGSRPIRERPARMARRDPTTHGGRSRSEAR